VHPVCFSFHNTAARRDDALFVRRDLRQDLRFDLPEPGLALAREDFRDRRFRDEFD
jgi:hypothetical protein